MENTTAPSIFSSSRTSLVILFFLSFVYFLENFDRSLISVSPIPYIDYGSYEYSILAGPAFTIVYTLGGVIFALMSFTAEQRNEGKGIAPSALFSKFNILALTTLVFSVSFACTAFALYFWQQVIVRIVMGLAQSIITPFSTSILSDHFPPQLRGSAFGIFNLGTYLSFSLALSLGIFIYVEYGWQAGYILFGAIGVVCALIMPVFSCFHARAENAEAEREKNITDADLTAQPDIGTKSAMHSEDESETPSPSGERQSVEKRDGQLNMWQRAQSRVHAMAAIAYDVCFVRWYNAPGIYLLCLATGVRLGAGYVWVSYTGALYSDLFETEDDSSCDFSYSADFALLPDSVCDSDYPYCVDGACSALTSFPWHNKGMDSLQLVEYMAWVPIVGSAFGNVLGGFVSDYLIGKQRAAEDDASALAAADDPTELLLSTEASSAAAARADAQGVESVKSTRRNSKDPSDQSVRMLIAGWSNLLPIPLITLSLLAPFPYCFLIMIASGMMGEKYMGQALAAITDLSVTPLTYITPSVALFMFVTTLIGGNTPLLIPLVASWTPYGTDVNIDFQAASVYAGSDTGATTESFVVQHQDARQLQYAMIYVLGFCYGLSGLLYLLSYRLMKAGRRAGTS